MGRLSTYAKNRILSLRFQKHNKITQIVKALVKEDIKVSRQSVSTFLKRYLQTDSIHDKKRTGRKRKLTNDEIQLIGEITRLNRDITARAIKDHLNLNVSTYTILRATKMFEWNKVNPNSNEAKKQAAEERETKGDAKRRGKRTKKTTPLAEPSIADVINESADILELPPCLQLINVNQLNNTTTDLVQLKNPDELYDLNLVTEREIQIFKNTACSPMSFATKILFKIYTIDELHGHNVSGKTFNKNVGHKEPLEEKRLMYIKWLVENSFGDENVNKDGLWKACCNAINKMIRRSEVLLMQKQNGGVIEKKQSAEDANKSPNSGSMPMVKVNSTMNGAASANNNNNSPPIYDEDEEEINGGGGDGDGEDGDFDEIEVQQPRRHVEQRLQEQKQHQQKIERVVITEDTSDEELDESSEGVQIQQKQEQLTTSTSSANTSDSVTPAKKNKKNFVVVAAAHQPKRQLRNRKIF